MSPGSGEVGAFLPDIHAFKVSPDSGEEVGAFLPDIHTFKVSPDSEEVGAFLPDMHAFKVSPGCHVLSYAPVCEFLQLPR